MLFFKKEVEKKTDGQKDLENDNELENALRIASHLENFFYFSQKNKCVSEFWILVFTTT